MGWVAAKMAVKRKTIVFSGINLFEGGPLSIYYDCLDACRELKLHEKFRLVAFVYKKELFRAYEDLAILVELPAGRKNYLFRLYYEYIYFGVFSHKHQIAVWLSLHDITPIVRVGKLYTYCHNPSPFLQKDLSKIKYSVKNTAFAFFYQYLYRINIKSADAVIVQQHWIRMAFEQMFPVQHVIVASPKVQTSYRFQGLHTKNRNNIFFYPAYPRYFKNFEVLLKACEVLEAEGMDWFRVWITIRGNENPYAVHLRKTYGSLRTVKWLGIQPRETVFQLYDQVDCLIFPSLMETWGLPISEFAQTGKAMILADLPYAHETAGDYEKCIFFDPKDAASLSDMMRDILEERQQYCNCRRKNRQPPDADGWQQLLKMLLGNV